MTFILHNGTFITEAPLLTIRDRGLRGDGVFDTMLCKDGQPIYAQDHFKRLINHATVLNIPIDRTVDALIKDAHTALDKNGLSENTLACLTTTITRGQATRGLQTPKNPDINIVMRAVAIPSMEGEITAISAKNVKRNDGSPLSQIKSLNYGDNILAKQEAEQAGVTDGLMFNNQGHATCFTIGNIFVLKDNQLYTPLLSDGCMNGIIRQKWIERQTVVEKSLTKTDIENADALFLTNSLRGIVRVAEYNGKPFHKTDFPIDRTIQYG